MANTIPFGRGRLRRYVATGLAVALGVGFLAAALILSSTMSASVNRRVAGTVPAAAVVVSPSRSATAEPDDLTAAQIEAVSHVPGVSRVDPGRTDTLGLAVRGSAQFVLGTTATPGLQAAQGRAPTGTAEVALGRSAAQASGAGVGDRVTLGAPSGQPGSPPGKPATVVGIVDELPAELAGSAGTPVVFATNDALATWTGRPGVTRLTAVTTDEAAADAARAAITASIGAGYDVRTGSEEADHLVREAAGGSDALTKVVLVFAAVALFVCVLVVANTFAIVLAQRARELALLRAIGADRRQVFRSVVAEAVVVGLIASLVGVAGALGATAALVAALRSAPATAGQLDVWAASPVDVLAPIGVGVLLTLLASLAPARRATAVSPLAALRPQAAEAVRRVGRLRIVAGIALAAVGFGLLAHGAVAHSLLTGLPGGAISFVGILVLAPVVVPALLGLTRGTTGRLVGVPGALAADNARRNPARAVATSSALLVGVTLIAMTSVGAATGQRAAEAELDRQYPVDVTVEGIAAADAPRLRGPLSGIAGVARVADAPAATTVPLGAVAEANAVGVAAESRAAMRDQEPLAALADGTMIVSAVTAGRAGVAEGARVQVRGHTFTVHVENDALADITLTRADLGRLDAAAAPGGLWLRLGDDVDVAEIVAEVHRVAGDVPGAQIGGAASGRQELQRTIDTVLLVVVALLLAAVVIAVVGVGNTLGLSVLERTRESALLRALGLTRGQLRGALAVEAVLLALVGIVLGTALGIVYGWAGVSALLGEDVAAVQLEVPAVRLAVAAAAAVAAALLASVLPARRAARVAPAEALAGAE